MTTVGIRDLQRDTSAIVDDVAQTGRPAFITNHGEPVAVMMRLDPEKLEDFVLANGPEYVVSMREADRDLAEGRTRNADDVIAELLGDQSPTSAPSNELGRLTGRERQVLAILAEGGTRADVAKRLKISDKTVRTHVAHILEKLGLQASETSAGAVRRRTAAARRR